MIDESIVIIDEEREKNALEKNTNYFVLLDFWMQAMEQNKTVSSFFKRRGYQTIAIYGMAALGKHLQFQLQNDVDILYTIDRAVITYQGQQYSMKENIKTIPRPDVMVITPLLEYESIKKSILELVDVDIISLEEVILSL